MSTSNWWADKLANPGRTQSTPPAQPVYQPPQPQQPQQPVYQQPVYQQPEQPRLPQSASASRCPGCGSGNYGGTLETRPRCYDCGYPVTQSGSGAAGINQSGSGPAQASKQVSTGGWNPTTIIGKIE